MSLYALLAGLAGLRLGCLIEATLFRATGDVLAGVQLQLHPGEALVAVCGFDEALRVNEDFDLLLRLGKAGYKITGSGEPTVMRRVHPRSLTRVDPERTLSDLERFLQKAEREGLLTPGAIASKRKWARLALGKKQVVDAETTREGIATLRQAFEHDAPKGLQQWFVYLLIKNSYLAEAAFSAYRPLKRGAGGA